MAATITGTVFNDLNHNGQFNPGEPGIPNVNVVLYSNSSGTCISTLTNVNGVYSFSVTVAGTYTIYETVTDSEVTCPPTTFTQPSGFTMSNGPRKLSVTVTTAQINNNATIANQNFSHDTTDNPLSCNTRMIQFAGRPSVWYYINVVTGATVIQGTVSPPVDINAIGYNPLDNYIYGYDQLNNNLVRVDNSGNVTSLFPLPPGFPSDSYTTGTFDLNGFFYIFVNNESRFYVIDLRPNSSTFLKLVNPATGFSEQTSIFGVALSSALNASDWVYNSADNRLYGITPTGVMERINPATGAITNLTTTPLNTGPFGAIAIDFNNTIYAISNSTGNIYRYTIVGNTATAGQFSNTVTTSFNDATLCPLAVINLDFGDAPDTAAGNGPNNYSTLLAKDGPRHQLLSGLVLGTQITSELDAYQNPTATGDDISKGIQDDGLTVPLPTLSISAASYTLLVTVTNTIGSPANLYGWLDFNMNGIFQGNEASPVQVVPSQPGTQIVPITFTLPSGIILTPNQTFLRLRLTSDTLVNQNVSPTAVDTRSLGAASDGEVEDYILQVNNIADLTVDKTNSPIPVFPGQELEYYIKVINNGPDAAENVLLTDLIPPEVLNPQYSLNGGATFLPWTGSIGLGTLPANESIPVLIRGTVSDTAVGTIINTAVVSSTTEDPDPTNNTSTSFAPVNQSADVSVVKSADPTPAVAGDLLTYSIIVSNAGPSLAENVVLIDAVPSQVTNPEFSVDGGITFNSWENSYSLGSLPNGASQTIILRGIVDAATVDTITNTAVVSSTTPDPDPTNNTSSIDTPVVPSADVSVVKIGSPSPVLAGQIVTYTIAASNAGPSTADNVVLTDNVPVELANVEFSVDGGITFNPWTGSYNIGTLVNGNTVLVILQGIAASSSVGMIVNTATINSTTPDPDLSNNTSTADIPIINSADVSVEKTAIPSPVTAGQLLTYTLLTSNAGPSDAENVTLTDAVPGELTDAQFSIDGGVSFNPWPGLYSIGTLVSGSSFSVLIRGTISTSATGTISNTATVDSTTPDPDPTNNTSTIITPIAESADLSIVKTASPNPIDPGQLITYSLVISNAGPSDAEDVTLTDAVPSVIADAEYSVDGGVTFNPWPDSINLGTIASGDNITVLLRGTVSDSATGAITNTATVNSSTPDPDPTNNTSTVITPINALADVSVVKIGNPDPVIAGDLLTYPIVVANSGPSDAANVTLTDTVPSELTNVEFSIDGGITYNPWPGLYNIGTLVNGGSITVFIRGIVNSAASGTIENTATVSSTTPDPDPTNNTSTFVTPVNTLADISVEKIGSPSPVPAGNVLTYNIAIANAGPSDSENVTLTDTIPIEIAGAEFSTDGGVTFNPWTGSVNIGTLANGASETILIRGTVDPSATGLITNTAVVSSSTPDPDPTNNTSTELTPINTSADISVTKTASPSVVIAGNVLTYTLTVSNAGPNTADNVLLTDVVPLEITGAEYSVDGGVTFNPWTGSLIIGTLANGASQTVLIRGTVNPLATGLITNTATVDSTTPDPDPTNNTSTIDTPVNTAADLAIVKTASPDPVTAGQLLTYTLLVSNAGPNDALDVTITDDIPIELSDVEFSVDGGVTFAPWTGSTEFAMVANGASQTIIIRGTVSPSTEGMITNTATVDSTTPDPDPTNNTSTIDTPVNASADLSVVKIANPDPVNPGELLTYNVVVSNAGPSDAEAVSLIDAVSSQIENPEFSLNGGITFNPWSDSVDLGTVASGDTVIIIIRGTVDSSVTGTITNTATVVSPTPDPDPTNNTSTIITPVNPSADISIVKTASPDPVNAGDVLTYNLVISNAGPSDAEAVILTDAVPSQLTNVEFSLDGGVTFNPWPGSFNLGTLVNGSSDDILIRGIVEPSASGMIMNTATVDSTTPDPDPTNNISTISVLVTVSADVTIVKIASTDQAIAGEELTYSIVVTNDGPSDAEAVTVTDVVPSDLINAAFSIDGGVTFNPWTGSYVIGALASGDTVTVLITGTVNSSASGTIANTVTVDSTTPDPDPSNNTSTDNTPVNTSADLSIVKEADPDPVNPGDVLTYTLTVTNDGPSDAEGVTLIDAVPSQIINPEFSEDGGITFNPWLGSSDLGTIGSGDSVIVLIRGIVGLSVTGIIMNTAVVSSNTPDPDPTNNSSTIVTPVIPSSDLSIVKMSMPNPVTPGQLLTYNLVISNAGPSDAEDVEITDTVPSQLEDVEFSIDDGVTFNPWLGAYTIGTLANGDAITLILRGTVFNPETDTITNTATVSSTTPDPDPTNNTSTIITPVTASSDLSIVKMAILDSIAPGQLLIYNLIISNAGPSDADNVEVADIVPSQLANVEFSIDGGVTFNLWLGSYTIDTLANGDTVSLILRGIVSDSATGAISNTAIVSSTTPDPDPMNNTSTIVTPVNGSSDLSIVKTSNSTSVIPGQLLTYDLLVTNEGPSDAENVVVTDSVPSQLTNVAYSIDGGVTFNPWSGSYTIGTLGNSFGLTIIIRGTVIDSASGMITNIASVSSSTPDPNPDNNTSSIVTPVNALADLSIVKTSSTNSFTPGQWLTYNLLVTNAGPSNAENVVVTDSVSSQLTNVVFSIDGGVTFNPWLGAYTIGTLANNVGLTIILRGTVINAATGTITNTATVSSTTSDPNTANNTSTNNTPISVSADISVVKTASLNPVSPGQLLTYTVIVSNNGPSTAENVTLIDAVSNMFSNVEFSTNGGTTFASWGGSLSIGTLANGASITILIRGMVNYFSSGSLSNTAIVSTTTTDLNPANNTSTVTVNIIGTANLSILKFGCPDQACPGQSITYTLVVSNAGPSNAENVTLTDIVSSMLRNVEFSTNGGLNYAPWTGSYPLGNITIGSSATVVIRGKISSFAEDMISNTATVSASTPDPELSNNASTFIIHIQKGEECKECKKCGKAHKCDKCNIIRKHHQIKKCNKCTKTHPCDKCRRAALKQKHHSRKALKLKRN
ncbi:DUF7507 domain-containing protein [Paenibacillus sp. VTT E-133280]|uniref:DUF7507 domain-containing protein n=1 Tax=Paenibacillus sp. VTT E-133280 TaxID=1986222 RepID=UPI000BA07AF4|nr:SdrD B-like domain-containing protein [Paenibacillus sp. VTT E-133280]